MPIDQGSVYDQTMTISPEIKRALRLIIIGQCAGLIGPLLFNNGFMLAYLLRLGIPAYRVLFFFALMPLINMCLTLPFAWTADHIGKKQLGGIGLMISIVGFLLLPLAGFNPHTTIRWLSAGILIFAIGNAATGASWFALLSPIVPQEIRGRWFGQMRTAWQSTAILFSFGLTLLLRSHSELFFFQLILTTAGILMIVRLILYLKIPELEPIQPPQNGFFSALGTILRHPGYLRFCLYMFVLTFICAANGLFGLMGKKVLGLSDSQVVLTGNLLSIGTVAGFLIGGKTVDRFGVKPVFMAGHILISLTLAGLLLRDLSPLSPVATLGLFSLLFGATQGATGIAGTSELLALIPAENKSLSTGFNMTLIAAGGSLASLLNGQLLKTSLLPQQWYFLGLTLNAYDALLAGFMLLAIVMATTLGLIPTIRHLHSQWIPQNR